MVRTGGSRHLRRDISPPCIECGAVAGELHAHTISEFNPFGEAIIRDGDDHGNVGVKCAFDQKSKTLAVALALAESVDNQEVSTPVQRLGDPGAYVLEPSDIKPAAGGGRVEI